MGGTFEKERHGIIIVFIHRNKKQLTRKLCYRKDNQLTARFAKFLHQTWIFGIGVDQFKLIRYEHWG